MLANVAGDPEIDADVVFVTVMRSLQTLDQKETMAIMKHKGTFVEARCKRWEREVVSRDFIAVEAESCNPISDY